MWTLVTEGPGGTEEEKGKTAGGTAVSDGRRFHKAVVEA